MLEKMPSNPLLTRKQGQKRPPLDDNHFLIDEDMVVLSPIMSPRNADLVKQADYTLHGEYIKEEVIDNQPELIEEESSPLQH